MHACMRACSQIWRMALSSLGLLGIDTYVEAAATPVMTRTIGWNPSHDCGSTGTGWAIRMTAGTVPTAALLKCMRQANPSLHARPCIL